MLGKKKSPLDTTSGLWMKGWDSWNRKIIPLYLICNVSRISEIKPLKPNGHYMYRQFNIQQFDVLPTQCIYVFCVDLRTYSDYFPIQH